MIWVDFDVDVSAAAGLGEPLRTRVSACLPDPAELRDSPIACFAFPGAGFGRGYYTFDMPGASGGGQAGWHARRGWIVFAVDHLGVGDSSLPAPQELSFAVVSAANHAAVCEALRRLAVGELAEGYPPVAPGVVLGLGQSMGGALVIHQQAHHRSFDAVGVLGFSAIHTTSRVLPGARPAPIPFLTRDAVLSAADPLSPESRRAAAVNAAVLELSAGAHYPTSAAPPPGWDYHFDDEPPDVVAQDLGLSGEPAPWRSATMPGLVHFVTAPGVVAAEAAAICVPVLAAFGERDVVEDPRLEPKAYRHAVDFSLFVCPRMAHMHNFASTREVFWTRIDQWGWHVAELKRRLPERWPSGLFSDSY